MTNDQPTADHPQTGEDILQLARGFQRSRVLLTAFELGLFSVLSEKRLSSQAIAATLQTDPRATDRLLNALCGLGLLTKEKGEFANTPVSAAHLVAGRPRYLQNIAHSVNLWDSWGTLTTAVRRGTAVATKSVREHDVRWREAFIGAMHTFGTRNAPEVVRLLDLSSVVRVLDVGGGPGSYVTEMIKIDDRIQPTVFDLPEIIPLTRKYLATAGTDDRIDTQPGDFHTDDFGGGYDLVLLFSILHMNSPEQNLSLLRRCAHALNHGGQLVIKDFMINEDRTSPPESALFALNMLVGTEAGDTYTETEIREWLTNVELTEINRRYTSFGSVLLAGRKK